MSKTKEEIKKYATALLWLCGKKQIDKADAQIAPKEFLNSLLEAAAKWAAANPGQDVFIYYDAELCREGAASNTQKLITEKYAFCEEQIKLKDIWDIAFVKNNPKVFDKYVDLYSRIDLLKLITILDLLLKGYDAANFADISVGGLRPDGKQMNKDELYSEDVLNKIYKTGIVTNIDKHVSKKGETYELQENQFIQAVNNEATLIALKSNIETCANLIKNILNNSSSALAETSLGAYIFGECTLRDISKYYQTYKKEGYLLLREKDTYVVYSHKNDNIDLRGTEFSIRLHKLTNGEVAIDKKLKFSADENCKAEGRETFTREGHSHKTKFKYLLGCHKITLWNDGFENTNDPILKRMYEGTCNSESDQNVIVALGDNLSLVNSETFDLHM